MMPEFGLKGPGDAYLAYLPLAHIMEIAGEMNAFAFGMTVRAPSFSFRRDVRLTASIPVTLRLTERMTWRDAA